MDMQIAIIVWLWSWGWLLAICGVLVIDELNGRGKSASWDLFLVGAFWPVLFPIVALVALAAMLIRKRARDVD